MAKQTFTTGQVLSAAQVNALQANDYNTTVSTKTASYVLVAADVGTTIVQNVATANTVTVNTGLFAAGDTLRIQNIGAGIATVTAGTATVNTANSLALPKWGSGILYFTSASAAIFFPSAGAAAAATFSGCKLTGSADQSIPNATVTRITMWNTETFDTAAYHDNVTNPSRITVPTSGYYLVSFTNTYASNGTGSRNTLIYKNGSAIQQSQDGATASTALISMTITLLLAANDYIELFAYQSSGVALNVLGGADFSFFQIISLGA